MQRGLRFATLGPAGTNSHEATEAYLAFHGISAEVVFVRHFFDALDMLRAAEVDHVVQVCAHPDVAETIERFHDEVFLVDTFVAPTRPMGVLTRADVKRSRSVGLMVATKGYFDVSRYETVIPEISNAAVMAGLLDGRYDSGFTSTNLLDEHPGRFRLDKEIGSIDVGWLVYGRDRVREGGITAWRGSPLGRLLRGEP